MISRIRTHRIDAIHRLAGDIRGSRCIVVSTCRVDIRTDVADEEPVRSACEDRHRVPRPGARCLLAAQVVRERCIELGGDLGLGTNQLVVDGDDIGDEAFASTRAGIETEEPDEIRTVGVEGERDATDLVTPRRGVARWRVPGR